jgi:hypothetical protein
MLSDRFLCFSQLIDVVTFAGAASFTGQGLSTWYTANVQYVVEVVTLKLIVDIVCGISNRLFDEILQNNESHFF